MITSRGQPRQRCLVTTTQRRMCQTLCRSRSGRGTDWSVTWKHEQRREADGVGQLERADRVHAEREDHAPVLRVVFQRKSFVNMAPESECQAVSYTHLRAHETPEH